eukprot:1809036-Prymnesium_polylepis.2
MKRAYLSSGACLLSTLCLSRSCRGRSGADPLSRCRSVRWSHARPDSDDDHPDCDRAQQLGLQRV